MTAPKLVRADRNVGSPYIPTGNPLVDAVGPASYADRADVPDLTAHGAAEDRADARRARLLHRRERPRPARTRREGV